MLFPAGDLTLPVMKQPSVKKEMSQLPTTAEPAQSSPLSTFSTLDAEGTKFECGNPSSTREGILRPIDLLTKVAQRGQQVEQQDHTKEGKRVAVSERTDFAVVRLVTKLALKPGAHNTYALEPEIGREARPVHAEGVHTPNNQTLRALLRTKDCLASGSPTQDVGESANAPLLKPHCERPRLGEQVEVRAGGFARSLPPSVTAGPTQFKVELQKSVNTTEVTSVTQGTAALSEENRLCHTQSGRTKQVPPART